MQNSFFTFLISLLFHFSIPAQVSFESTVHDFGKINEQDGVVTHDFTFKNTGSQAIKIKSVTSDCGCTVSAWTQEAIDNMQSGKISVEFDPHNRPGSFEKSLRVLFSDGSNSTLLIKGSVYFESGDLKRQFPIEMGGIRFSGKVISLGNIYNSNVVSSVVAVYNHSENTVSWDTLKAQFPKFIKVSYSKTILNPRESGYIEFEFNPSMIKQLGFLSQRVDLYTNEKDNLKSFSITTTIFDHATNNRYDNENSPGISVNRSSYDFGKVYRTTTIDSAIIITNTGNQNLMINKIDSNCSCLQVSSSSKLVLPGQQINLKLMFNPKDRNGRVYSTITIFTNDASTPAQTISIKAEI